MAQEDLLLTLISTPIDEPIPPLELAKALSTAPFTLVPGTFNTRTLAHPSLLRGGLVYRSGSLWDLTAEGKRHIVEDLNIKAIFDLRSAGEKKAFPMPAFQPHHNVEIVSLAFDSPPAELNIADYIPDPSSTDLGTGGSRGYSKQYLEALSIFKSAFRQVLTYLLVHPNSAILFNCTAGKDRTGVLAALILALAGVPDDDIAFDYALSRIGIEPQKEFLTAIVKKWKPEWTEDTPGVREFSNVSEKYMLKFLEDARVLYGRGGNGEVDAGDGKIGDTNWAERYVLAELGFSKEEVETLQENLRNQEINA
ncbi:hypothetical protein CLAIMM_08158 [Cladophialophora immunda]|nr:hypothetical protein CLAIMM_08158 [Cladophialophora immunda]